MSNWQSSSYFSATPRGTSYAVGGNRPVNPESSSSLDDQYPDSLGSDVLSIALIGPDEERRKAAATALAGCQGGEIREYSSYPPSLDDVPTLLEQHDDVIILDLDSQPEYALELVESICASSQTTVMVYSVKADSELLVRCMRAGAREFLTIPFAKSAMAEALVRASARRPATRTPKKAGGRLLVFLGAKGGDGVTTLACNFAVSLAQESGESTLLIDLDLPLGDAALNLGVVAEYSAINALQNFGRLDASFLSKLLVKHSSGVSVLAAPGKFPQFDASDEAIDKLIMVARQEFDNVVIDMGSRLDLMGTSLFKEGSTVYLVIQAGIAGLRNSNRLISQYFNGATPKLEIVLNRYEQRSLGVSEDQITKALTRPAQWKIPNDYNAVRRMQNTAVPLALEDSPISRLIHQMARTSCGLPAMPEKKSGFSLKSLSRSISARVSGSEEAPSLTQLGLTSSQDDAYSASSTTRSAVAANTPEKHTYASPALAPSAPESNREAGHTSASAPSQRSEPLTRTYKGATYTKSPDGEWHLVQAAPRADSVPVKSAPVESAPVERAPIESSRAASPEPPTLAWSTPAPIAYGTALSNMQLRALASVPGKFVYTPAVGEVLSVGTHTLSVAFTPTDRVGYTAAQATVSLTVNKATPAITWPMPTAITHGTPLSGAQLNATASVPGKFVYSPAADEVLEAGKHSLAVTFTPAETEGYATVQATVPLIVAKSIPSVEWPTPSPIAYGTPLGAAQQNAVASVEGKFAYTPEAGTVLPAGVQTLAASFTPADATNYATVQASVALSVTKSTPAITWPAPASIVYGTPLGAAQLNATASIPGRFVYLPAAGAVLSAGTHTPSVTFTPADTAGYTTAQAAVRLIVNKATPVITWPVPASIAYGTALSDQQLNATASVPGKFVYTPAAGETLPAGTHTLSVVFTPNDGADYGTAQATVTLSVTKAKPATTSWPTPAAISHGTPIGADQLNATAPIPGTFVYTPAAGQLLATGTHTLSVTFTPKDANIPAAQATVQLTVTKATPTVSWSAPAPITFGAGLSSAQLNASASVPGRFSYAPGAGEMLAVGTHKLSVTFTPTDAAGYTTVQAAVSLTVTRATPIITWPTPSAISYGTALCAEQLNAKALVPGTFVYTPDAGTVLNAGAHTLSATFIPKDTADYTTAQATVTIKVEELPNIASIMPATAEAGADRNDMAGAKRSAIQSNTAPNQQSRPETRTYKGATYVKGADGQWYLQKN